MTNLLSVKKNICYFTLPAYGHIYPSLDYIRKLVKKGHTVYYFSVPKFKDLINSVGANYVDVFAYMPTSFKKEYANLQKNMFISSSHLLQTAGYSMKISYQIVNAVSDNKSRWNPELVIHDNCCLWGKILANIWQVPAICTFSTFVYSGQDLFSLPLSWIFYEVKEWKAFYTFLSFRKKLLKKFPELKITFFDMIQNREKTNILFMDKKLQKNSQNLPTNFHFIPRPFQNFGNQKFIPFFDKDFVYVSLGTIHSQNSNLYQLIINILGKNGIPAIVSLGGLTTQIKNNYLSLIKIYREVNQIETLKSCSICITHGGMNSCLEAIHFKVPMIILPQTSEQVLVGKRIKTLGMGDVLLKRNISSTTMEKFILRCIQQEKYSFNSLEKQV